MIHTIRNICIGACLMGVFLPAVVSAHQPRITTDSLIYVLDPEISKAYYGELTGEPHVYVIESDKPFDLYINVLVPDIEGQETDVSATVIKDGNVAKPFAILDGLDVEWEQFYEPFGADTYFMGPEFRTEADPGTYEIYVSSSNNDSKYSLAIGEIEAFDRAEIFNALTTIPELKKNFFEVSPIGFVASPFGWGLIVLMYLLAGVFVFLYRLILKKVVRKKSAVPHKNIGTSGRVFRVVLGIALLLWAMLTTWSPILIFFSGFAIFEGIFSWCALYQLIGRNTCDM